MSATTKHVLAFSLTVYALLVSGSKLSQTVTPVEKVTELLKQLREQVTQEGKDEAAAYDKYACFCKEQADNKLYQIETSKKKIVALGAKIEELSGIIDSLSADVQELGLKISGFDKSIENLTAIREGEHEQYLAEEADVSQAIDAVKRAIEALESSKSDMKGKAELEAFAQVREVAKRAWSSASKEQRVQIQALGATPGQSYTSSYHSNEIIGTLEKLLATFTDKKSEVDQAEFESNADFEKKRLALQNQKQFATKEREEKQALSQAKDEERSAAEESKMQETRDKDSDQSFLDVVTAECENKAQLWDQRSKTRAGELTALSEAIEHLQKGVSPNYAANEQLVDLQMGTGAKHQPALASHALRAESAYGRPVSLIQFRQAQRVTTVLKSPVPRVLELLSNAAHRLGSSSLATAVLKVRSSEDHFVKVRMLIKDLVARLEEQKAAEDNQKSFCDREMKRATSKRDETMEKLESLEAEITIKTSKKSELVEEIAELAKGIAANAKALNEATELRADEKAENKKTISEASSGLSAVEMALGVLEKFYGENALLQRGQRSGAKYVPPNSDREGKTVDDLAPDVFDSEYKGQQEGSKGVLGMLEVIRSDFERTISTVTEEESEAEAAFLEFKKTNEADTMEKKSLKAENEAEVSNIEDQLVELADDKKAAKDEHALALKELEELSKQCVEGEESYEERVAKRNKEIEACKQALAILEEWKD